MTLPHPAPGRTAIVTGASSGIGTEIAKELSRRGHHVTLVARREDRLRDLAAGCTYGAEVIALDLADRQARASLLERVLTADLTPDVLVNNAGFSTVGPVAQADPARELQMVEVDVAAVTDLCTRFLPGMVERRAGAVLNVASTAAFQPLPGQAGYAACKAFVLSYTEALAAELSGTGVTATAVCPGPVATEFLDTAGFGEGQAEQSMPRWMWVDADAVARAAVDGAHRGARVVIPGAPNRISALLAHHAPNSLILPFVRRGHPALRRK